MNHLNKYYLLLLFCITLVFSVSAQDSSKIWSKKGISNKKSVHNLKGYSGLTEVTEFNLNLNLLKNALTKAPKRKFQSKKTKIILNFPNGNGELEKYEVFEASIMQEKLQNEYSNIRTYIGKGIDNPNSVIRFSITSLGFHGMVLGNTQGTSFIDPYSSDNSYMVYKKSDLSSPKESFQCKFDDLNSQVTEVATNISKKQSNANDGKLRTYRLAIATTGEYSQFHLEGHNISPTDPLTKQKEIVLSAIVTTMTRVNAIFERDVALTMVLVNNNSNLIFFDEDTDGFTNDDSGKLIEESQTKIDQVIGSANYDIGHTFSTGGGGLAQLNSPCIPNQKAKGITGSSTPTGPTYDIDYVAHEMGHQFGAHHTFNSESGNCSGNINRGTAVEPGSGSTIMAYSGLCAPHNVKNASDDYFHLVSIREMWDNIYEGASTCGALSDTNNNAPVIEELQNYTVPISTPFQLTANASDSNGDDLTYTWEQLDTETTVYPLTSTSNSGPAFRSFPPSENSTRIFPNIETVLTGGVKNLWEVLPSVSRTMRFGVNVRDNRENGGQTASQESILTFSDSAGPFEITSQTNSEEWSVGTAQTISWDVANTDKAPIYCATVNILFSEDGGQTFPITLASNIPNNGSYNIVAPNNITTTGRIKVESVGNVFFNTNVRDITINQSEFVMNFEEITKNSCAPNEVIYNMTYNAFLGFNEETTFSATGFPEGATVTFNPTSAIDNNTAVEMKVTGIDEEDKGLYSISIKGSSSTVEKNTAVSLNLFSSIINAPTLSFPENNSTGLLEPYNFNWDSDENIVEYTIEIASDINFNNTLETATLTASNFESQSLSFNTTYYWRVKGVNDCGESSFSNVFNFKTADVTCETNNSLDTPLNIPDNSSIGVSSIINITNNKIITDVNVTVNAPHEWVGDLTLTLMSPSGTEVLLSANNGDEGLNYTNTVFDDQADSPIVSGTAPFTGVFLPQGSLSILNNEESYGYWILKAVDGGPEDLGSIQSWNLEICGVDVVSNDDDKDGVLNDVDICENTPLGSTVNSEGCAIFTLANDNFTIEAIGETCLNKHNGEIRISAKEAYPYSLTINGTEQFFSSSIVISNLEPNSYDFCIEVKDQFYKQCFSVDISEGEMISGKTTIDNTEATIEIENGTAPFTVFVNKSMVLETDSNSFKIAVKQGDLIEVKTSVECEGVYAKAVNLIENVVAYPNPTKGNFEIDLFTVNNSVLVELYNIQGQMIFLKQYPVVSGKIGINISNLTVGLYFVKVNLEKPIFIKVIKE